MHVTMLTIIYKFVVIQSYLEPIINYRETETKADYSVINIRTQINKE